MKNDYKYIFLVSFLLLVFSANSASAQILDPVDFGFEETSVLDWTQVAGFEEETTIVTSGLKSMKADLTYPTSGPKLQTYRGSGTSNGAFALSAGNYELSAMVYLVGDVPTGLKISPTSDPLFPTLSLAGITKGQWVKVTIPFTVSNTEVRSDVWVIIQLIGMPSSGSGTVYIDDIVIEGEVIEEVPSVTKIETVEGANLNLISGLYTISLNVWIDPNAEMSSFYTYIENPWTAIKWDFDGIAKGEWVTLNKDFILEAPVENSKFRIQVNKNPELGGGKGVFFIDDIEIVPNDDYKDSDNFTIAITSETCPNKNNGEIAITAKYSQAYQVLFNEMTTFFTDEISLKEIEPGTYPLCISVPNFNFEQCYTVTIDAGITISGKTSISKNEVKIVITEGTAPYNVSVNDEVVLQTHSTSFSVQVTAGDVVEVRTVKVCENVLSTTIGAINNMVVFPNPASDIVYITCPVNSKIDLYNIMGSQVKSVVNTSESLKISVSNLSKGIYIFKITTLDKIVNQKLVIDYN
jgi:hypothetical protein